jgi:PadR family transcriptional regulator PadR
VANEYLGILDIGGIRWLEWLGMPPTKADILQGTLDMLVMRAVADEPLHGYALVHRLKLISGGRLDVPQGSLYPALHRLENRGLLKAEWQETQTGREAKVYRLTAKGRRQLDAEVKEWKELSLAIALILDPA